jgi:single-stranded DNA-binding protein
MDYQKLVLYGTVVGDIRRERSKLLGFHVTEFVVEVTDNWKRPTQFDVTAFGSLSEVATALTPGQKVLIEGRLDAYEPYKVIADQVVPALKLA